MKERTEVIANEPMFPQVNNQMNTLVLIFYLFLLFFALDVETVWSNSTRNIKTGLGRRKVFAQHDST